MLAFLADTTSDVTTIGPIVGVVALIGTMLKMLWDDRTRGQTIEAALRKSFADERASRELEVTAEKLAAEADYQKLKARHLEIHTREIAAFQDRITAYIEQQDLTKERVTVLEARVLELTNEIIGLKR